MNSRLRRLIAGAPFASAGIVRSASVDADQTGVVVASSEGIRLEARFEKFFGSSREVKVDLVLKNDSDKPFVSAADDDEKDALVPTFARKRSIWVPHIGFVRQFEIKVSGPDGEPVTVHLPDSGSRSHGELKPGEVEHYSLELSRYCRFAQAGEHRCWLTYRMGQEASARPGRAVIIALPQIQFEIGSVSPDREAPWDSRPSTSAQPDQSMTALGLSLLASFLGLLVMVTALRRRQRRNRSET